MTSRDSYVDDAPSIERGDHFERWLEITSSPARIDVSAHRALETDMRDPSTYLDTGYPRRLELSIDSRQARFLDWLFSRRVRRSALTITTCGVLAFAVWLLASELTPSAEPAVDFSAFAPASESAEAAIQSTSAAIEAAAAVQTQAPMLSSDGRIQLTATAMADGWIATVEQIDPSSSEDVQVGGVRMLVNGEVIGESNKLPFDLTIAPTSMETDVATLIVSAVVDWSNGTSSPVSVAVANPG